MNKNDLTELSITADDGAQLNVVTAGPSGGEPVVLIHGHGAEHGMWNPQLERYAREGYYLIAPDMRGHGKSAPALRIEAGDWAEDLYCILRHLAIDQVHLIGVSMGGIIAGEFTCRYPAAVRSLILSDSFGKLRGIKETALGTAFFLSFRFLRLLPRSKLADYYGGAYDFPGGEKAAQYFRDAAMRIDFRQLAATRRAINRIDTEERLSRYAGPSLVMVGTRPGELFVNMSHRLANALGTQAVLLEGALDPSNLTAAEQFDRRVLAFLASAGRESTL